MIRPRLVRLLALTVLAAPVACSSGSGSRDYVADPQDRGLVASDQIQRSDVDPAIRDLCQRISRKNAEGWPDYVVMSQDTPPKPVIRLSDIVNRTRDHFDVVQMRNMIMNAIVEQDVCFLAPDAATLEAIMAERDYSQAGMTVRQINYGNEDATGLVLRGEVTMDDPVERDGLVQFDYTFTLRLFDTNRARAIIVSETRIRKMRERGTFGG